MGSVQTLRWPAGRIAVPDGTVSAISIQVIDAIWLQCVAQRTNGRGRRHPSHLEAATGDTTDGEVCGRRRS